MFVQVHGIIIMPMWSAYTEANTKKDIVWIRNTIKKINVISGVLTVGAIITIFIFKPVVSIWLGKNLEYSYGLIFVTAVYVIMQMFANNYSSFLCGIGNIKISAVISLISAAANIPLSIFFAYMLDMKLTGIMLGSLIVMSISFFVLPAVSHKWIKAKETEWTIQEKSYE